MTDPAAVRADARPLSYLDRLDRLFVAVVSDSLDQVGLRNNIIASHIRPLRDDARLVGFASTVELQMVTAPPAAREDAYRGELEAIDALQPGDVMVVSTCPGSYWGEMLTIAAMKRRAQGIVADAFTRDVKAVRHLGFPTFVSGISAQDSLGRTDVVQHGNTIDCGGVSVSNGDLVIGDVDGVAVIPWEVADEVIGLAENRVAIEGQMRGELEGGLSISSAFSRFGVL